MEAAQEKADAVRAQMQEMKKMMQANQTNTDAKLESLSDKIEKTQMALQRAEMCRDTKTNGLKEDLTKPITKPAKVSRKPNASSKPGWTKQDRRGPRGQTHRVSARAQFSHQRSSEKQHGVYSDDNSRSWRNIINGRMRTNRRI
jgi:hypothetical protein